MILVPEILAILILNVIFGFFAIIAFILSIKIFLYWDLDSTSTKQYKLEKQSFLSAIIIKYIFLIKIPLFLFFIFTLDKLSTLLTGAMCGAGVVDATIYGNYLFVFKIINLYIFSYWLSLHNEDMKYENQPYTKMKFGIFIFIFFLFISELILEWVMFLSIDINDVVDCCGTIYSDSSTSYISNLFKIDILAILSAFYGTFISIYIAYIFKQKYIFSILNVMFIIISIISLITFFGTYIYQLPTHHCPFCLLQRDYYYVGYLLYSLLYVGTFNGIVVGFLDFSQNDLISKMKLSLLFNLFYLVLVSAYVIVFYVNNGVLLE